MRYTMLQLFLARRDEGTMFSRLEPRQSREKYIQEAFSAEVRFEHWRRPYVYKPFASPDTLYVVGVIAKEHTVTIAGPPEEAFAHKDVEDWETANVLIDSSPDSQKAAMQPSIGQPLHIFRSFVDHINEHNSNAEWTIAVNPITEQEEFWDVAERFKGHIAEVDLSFAVPNIWGGETETEKALKELKTENNAQEIEVKIKNKDGKLNPDSERVRQSVDYISKGGGTASLRDDHQTTIYSSDNEESIVSVPIEPDFPIQEADEGLIASLIKRLFGK